jgi:hypothetical protein
MRAGSINPVIGLPGQSPAQRPGIPTYNVNTDAEAQQLAQMLAKTGQPFSVRTPGQRPQQAGTRVQLPAEEQTALQATRGGLEQTLKFVSEGREKASGIRDSLEGLSQAQEAIRGGAFQGRLADFQMSASALASAIPGLSFDQKKLANSEVAQKHLTEQVLARIKQLGANPSNADREYIEKTVPQLTNNPIALERLVNYTQSLMLRSLESHNAAADRYHKVKGASPEEIGMDYRVQIPETLRGVRADVVRVFREGTPEQRKKLIELGYVQ